MLKGMGMQADLYYNRLFKPSAVFLHKYYRGESTRGAKRQVAKRLVGAKRLGGKRPGGKCLGGETTRGETVWGRNDPDSFYIGMYNL